MDNNMSMHGYPIQGVDDGTIQASKNEIIEICISGIKDYQTTSRTRVKMAEEGFYKAETSEERCRCMNIVQKEKKEQRRDIILCVGVIFGCFVISEIKNYLPLQSKALSRIPKISK